MARALDRHRQHGFTLIEAVIVIMLTGVVGAMIATFIRQPIEAYVDQARRGEMSDAAEGALRRIARELKTALPNSVRVSPSGTYLEFLPVRAAGRYRAAPTATGTGDWLDFSSSTDNSFDVLGPSVNVSAGDQLVIYNLGLVGADAYAGTSRRALNNSGTALANLSYTVAGTQFPYASPSKRFHIVSTPVTYVCSPGPNGTLRRYAGYAIQAAQPTNAAAAPLSALTGANNAPLVAPIAVTAPAGAPATNAVTACSFSASTSASSRNAVVTLRLTLTSGGRVGGGLAANESITLLMQAHVENSP